MSDQLKMHSPNLVDANIEKIAVLFPNCVTEAQGENGELKKAIDFDLLKQELSQVIVEGEQERYRLDWVGKKESILTANAPIAKTLRPCREESVNFDTTENLFIEGDNLEALKLLQENYLGKVKMIYIDPPYNTGNDFIYEDDFAESTDEFFERSNQTDDEGNKLVANTDSNGRFHSDWLSMIYSRLKLARNLLRDDGVIFISISDKELHNLRKICDEIYGESNFVTQIVWEKIQTRKNSAKYFSESHDHILVYCKQKHSWKRNLIPRENTDTYSNPDNDPRGPWKLDRIYANNEYSAEYTIKNPITGEVFSRPKGKYWRYSEASIQKFISEDKLIFSNKIGAYPNLKRFLSEVQDGLVPVTIFDRDFAGDNGLASREISNLFGVDKVFSYPKPTKLLKRLLQIGSDNDSICMDFFAGSASLGDAVMQLNYENESSKRKFILVQIDEEVDKESEADKLGFNKISDLAKERLKLSYKKLHGLNSGFRVLKIDSTNMKDVYYTPDAYKQVDILDLADHIKEDRTSEDLLFQVMLDWGLELSLPIERKIIQSKEVFYVAGNSLVACFDEINFAMVDEIAQDKPLRVVSAERAIQLDHDKTNIKGRFKQLSPETEVKFI